MTILYDPCRKIILHEDTDVLLSDYAVLKVSEEEYENWISNTLLRSGKKLMDTGV